MDVGDTFGFEKPVTEDQPDRYGEASGDTNPIHTDEEFARSVGLDGVILQGLCTMSFAHQAVTEWAGGDPTDVERLKVRFADNVYPGDEVRFDGEVVAVEDGRASIDIVGTNQHGDVVLENAEATVQAGSQI